MRMYLFLLSLVWNRSVVLVTGFNVILLYSRSFCRFLLLSIFFCCLHSRDESLAFVRWLRIGFIAKSRRISICLVSVRITYCTAIFGIVALCNHAYAYWWSARFFFLFLSFFLAQVCMNIPMSRSFNSLEALLFCRFACFVLHLFFFVLFCCVIGKRRKSVLFQRSFRRYSHIPFGLILRLILLFSIFCFSLYTYIILFFFSHFLATTPAFGPI